MLNPTTLSAAGLVLILAGAAAYARRIARGGLARGPFEVGLGLLLGSVSTLGALVWALLEDEASGWVFPISLSSLSLVAIMVFLHVQRRVPRDTLRVRMGDRLLAFEAQTSHGELFSSDQLAGRRVLLKFYRGEWCPFCQAELRQFDAMHEDLSAHGVEVIALSKDTPEAARRHLMRDGLRMQLLCDPELRVIRQYGVEHRKALEISGGPQLVVFGLALGTRPTFRHMAAPTTLLIDEHGVIRWIDQTDDYKVRSSAERVLGAVEAAFGAGVRSKTRAHVRSAAVRGDEPSCAPC